MKQENYSPFAFLGDLRSYSLNQLLDCIGEPDPNLQIENDSQLLIWENTFVVYHIRYSLQGVFLNIELETWKEE